MSNNLIAICIWCKHLHIEKANTMGKLSCSAFLNGIPDEIVTSEFDHRKEHIDDNGIIFELQTDEDKFPNVLMKIVEKSPMSYQSMLRFMLDAIENRGKNLDWYHPSKYIDDSNDSEA